MLGRSLDHWGNEYARSSTKQGGKTEREHHDPVDVDAHKGRGLAVVGNRLHRTPYERVPLHQVQADHR